MNKYFQRVRVFIAPNLTSVLFCTISLGPKIGYTLNTREFENSIPLIVKESEYIVSKLSIDSQHKNRIRAKITTVINNQRHFNKQHQKIDKANHDLQKTISFLKEHPNLIVSNSDKDKSTVILDRQTYENGMNNLLSDRLQFKKN